MGLYTSVIKCKKQNNWNSEWCRQQSNGCCIEERPLATPTTQDTPKTTEDLLTRTAIALEDVAASLKPQGGYTGVKQ
jgi:hypothetical protein